MSPELAPNATARLAPALLTIGCALSVVPPSAADSTATVTYSVAGGAPKSLAIPSVTTPSGADSFYASTNVDGLVITWSYQGYMDATGNSVLNGTTTLKNTTGAPISFAGDFSAPLCPMIVGDVLVGGSANAKVVCDADGGVLTCGGDTSGLVSATGDGAVTETIFYCPFTMATSGPGTIATNGLFGAPFPSRPGPPTLSSLGHRLGVTVTPGDKAVLSLLYVANGTRSLPGDCAADVDGDGMVGVSDLLVVLESFGSSAICGDSWDVNRDGIVDGTDLADVMSAWGACPR
ncbi:MAG: dockerin type I domain-containing protein [Phycisphaerales bacterium]